MDFTYDASQYAWYRSFVIGLLDTPLLNDNKLKVLQFYKDVACLIQHPTTVPA